MFTYLSDSVYTLNWGGWVLETPNWVPGVPLMIGGAMPLLNPIVCPTVEDGPIII